MKWRDDDDHGEFSGNRRQNLIAERLALACSKAKKTIIAFADRSNGQGLSFPQLGEALSYMMGSFSGVFLR